MLAIIFVNDNSGDVNIGHYDYRVMINKDVIAKGRVEKHDRNTGWKGLIKKFTKQLEDKK